jgi:hypothetical protein
MPNKANGKSSADYYKENPESYRKKKAAQKKINARPEERAKRSELVQRNREADKRGVNRTGKDYDHGSKRYIASSTNRGKKSGTPGDRKARGGK